jgi:phosphate transport system protein
MATVRRHFQEEMALLERDVLRLGSLVESMVADALRALVNQDTALAEEVIRRDDVADDLDLAIEQASMRLLALQQPMAQDLRVIGTTLKAIADLERIGDYSVDIARAAKVLSTEPFFKPLEDIPRMAEMAQQMVRDVLRAFVQRDLDLVERVCEQDNEVDRLWYALLEELMEFMRRDPALVKQATYLLLVARYLERVADHATNVAERVYYIATGELKQLVPRHKGT